MTQLLANAVPDIIIFGAAKVGLEIKRSLSKLGYKVLCFCDNNPKKHGLKLDGLDIIPFDRVSHILHNNFDGIIVLGTFGCNSMVDQIRSLGIQGLNVFCPRKKYLTYPLSGATFNDMLVKIDYSKPRLFGFQYHVTAHCNLNCDNCANGSNYAPPVLEISSNI